MKPDFSFERRAGGIVAGIDEAGRGPWAGPVVAAAVVLTPDIPDVLFKQIDDSKKLSPRTRVNLYRQLNNYAEIRIGTASVNEIDDLNILRATMLAMQRAIEALTLVPNLALVDGNSLPDLLCPARSLVRGDERSVASASIAAKVIRDDHMTTLAARYPGYGWERNKGYGTAEHRAALDTLGPTIEHRFSFAPVARAVQLREL